MFILELDHCPVAEPLVQTSQVWPHYCTLANTCGMLKNKSAHINQRCVTSDLLDLTSLSKCMLTLLYRI